MPSTKKKGPARIIARIFVLATCLVVIASAVPMLLLRWADPPTTSFMRQFEASSGRPGVHYWADWEDISPHLALAVMAAEDQRFPSHFGLDLTEIRDALSSNSSRSTPRGASTITQQTIKNLFLTPERSYTRKAIEAWLAVWMDLLVPKQRILEIYLNIAQLGPREFGAEAASQRHFSVAAAGLTPRQAALMAAALPTPSVSTPGRPSEYLDSRADFLLDQMSRMERQGYLVVIAR